MIYESKYWKDDLLRSAKALEAKIVQKRRNEASSAKLEKNIVIWFLCN